MTSLPNMNVFLMYALVLVVVGTCTNNYTHKIPTYFNYNTSAKTCLMTGIGVFFIYNVNIRLWRQPSWTTRDTTGYLH